MIIKGEYAGDEPVSISEQNMVKGTNAASKTIASVLGFSERFVDNMLVMRNSESLKVLLNVQRGKVQPEEEDKLKALIVARPNINATVGRSDAEMIDDHSTARLKNQLLNMLNSPPPKKEKTN